MGVECTVTVICECTVTVICAVTVILITQKLSLLLDISD